MAAMKLLLIFALVAVVSSKKGDESESAPDRPHRRPQLQPTANIARQGTGGVRPTKTPRNGGGRPPSDSGSGGARPSKAPGSGGARPSKAPGSGGARPSKAPGSGGGRPSRNPGSGGGVSKKYNKPHKNTPPGVKVNKSVKRKTKPPRSTKKPKAKKKSGNIFINLNDTSASTLASRLSAGPECNTFYLEDGSEGILYSGADKTSLNCYTTIQSPAGTTISIQCPHFDLSPAGCRSEQLSVYDPSSGTQSNFCQRDAPTFTTTGNALQLHHRRRHLRGNQCTGGFICAISVGVAPSVVGQCGDYTLGYNQFSILFSNNDGGATTCAYNIAGPVGDSLQLYCTLFAMETRGCRMETLTLTDNVGGSTTTYCSNDPAPNLDILSNSITLVHTLKKALRKKCSGGFLCYVGASAPIATTPAPGHTSGPVPTVGPAPANGTARPYCPGCGISQVTVPRIVGGETATPGEYPWQAKLDLNGNICGGTLIKKDWVLTAAHCFNMTGAKSATVTLGAQDRTDTTDPNLQTFQSSTFYVHPNYDSKSQNNDIALVYLGKDAVFNNRVQPICIGQASDIIPGAKAISTGWGVLQSGSTTPSNTLQEVSLDVITDAKCASLYQNTYTITQNMLCTLSTGKDACQGDSGGPLISQISTGQWVQIGVVSFGEGCANANKPGVFTNVAMYSDWIKSTTGGTKC